MKRQITSLPALESFRVAAEFESFSKAANQLNLTHGAVSRAVRLLESDLGTTLFIRRNRAVFLTDDGRKLAKAVAHGLGHIEAAVRSIRAARANVPITVSCEPTLMMRWLIPRISQFYEQHPQADIHMVAGGGSVILGQGIDLAIRRDDFDLPHNYSAQTLFAERIGPVCRPDLRDRFFDGHQLRADAPLLHSRTRPSAWQTWENLTNVQSGANPALEFEHFYFSLQAAVAGLGVAIAPWHLVCDDLDAGILLSPLGFIEDGSKYLLLAPEVSVGEQAEKIFSGWLTNLTTKECRSE